MAHDWGYSSLNGPHTWSKKYATAAGHRQSPINIETSTVILDPNLQKKPLKVTFPSKTIDVNNPGYCWKAHVRAEDSCLEGGPLEDTYRLLQFHCHWGPISSKGSEHHVDGRSFAGEIHFVHMNTKYSSFEEALKHDDGLAVLAVFLSVGKEHTELEKLVSLLSKVTYKNQTAEFEQTLDLNRLLPSSRAYWTYPGSLTTPPCDECVIWIVFKEPIEVSEEQLKSFRKMSCHEQGERHAEHNQIIRNYRPPLSVGNRIVRASYN